MRTALAVLAAALVPVCAQDAVADTGGATYVAPPAPVARATLVDGKAVAPRGAPRRVRRVIAAANAIIDRPYRWGGGHGAFTRRRASGYDCSGAVSHALRGGRFLASPLDSSGLRGWGARGRGRWITVYGNRGHAFMTVAGLRFDTGMRDSDAPPPRTGPRWSTRMRSARGFAARHPSGF